MWNDRKDRAGTQERSAQKPRYNRCSCNRDETAWSPLKKKKFDRKQCRRYRRCENSRHSAGGTCDQQRFSLCSRQMKKLCENRATGPTGHDNGPLRAERTARPDRDRRRNRFEDRYFGFNRTAALQNRFQGFWNPVTADLLRPVASHQTNDKRARNWSENDPRSEMIVLQRTELR